MGNLLIEHVREKLVSSVWELIPSQNSICFPIVSRLYVKMKIGLLFSGIIVDKSLIIDGHHRYIASKMVNFPIEICPGIRTSGHQIFSWRDVRVVEEDWDTPEKIKFLNQQDAFYNGYSVEQLSDILK